MANKCAKYIVVLLMCCCFCTVCAYGQADTTQSSSTDTSNNETTEKSTLDKFSVKGKQDIVTQRRLPDSSIQAIKNDKDYWYANKKAGSEQQDTEEKKGFWYYLFKLLSSDTFRLIFWMVVIGGFVAIVTMYLINSKVWLFAGRSKKIRNKEVVVEGVAENIFTMNFEEHINKALNEQNYRLATRLLFLRLLRSLSQRNIIQYGIDKTNMDYMFELGNTKYFKAFAQASRTYEYVWYGNFEVQQSQFLHIKQQLDDLNQKIGY